tara:strand:- start:15411 stop:16544 length:1134 start_codon:yes stop_codon:yes gene_type:complete
MPRKIKMVDLRGQYNKIKSKIDDSITEVLKSTKFINGPQVKSFSDNLSKYLNVKHVIPCANGTDALQIALMSLDLNKNDEIICPSFTYVSTAEVISLLGFKPIMADVDKNTFNITAEIIEPLITSKTKAIVPVHLFGQSCDMEPIINLAKKNNLYVIEDNAQALGSDYTFKSGIKIKTGTIGDIGTTSFFPSKNLGCYGDGGAIFTNDDKIAKKISMIANHGQEKKYYHKVTGCNSRLDSLQAAILDIKLNYLDDYSKSRNVMADNYDYHFSDIKDLIVPFRQYNSSHVFHQYTLKINPNLRSDFKNYLNKYNIPVMIYYPLPLYKQEAFSNYVEDNFFIENIENICKSVISLPIHTEVDTSSQEYIIKKVKDFFLI